jgi:single-stranded DNA-specific DHH superfamily exonuclease
MQQELLNSYTKKLLEIELFKKENAQIFKDLENLETQKEELEKELHKEVKENGDLENEIVKCTRVERWKKSYSYPLFLANATDKEVNILNEFKGIKQEIDKPVFENCVEEGLISTETAQKSFQEELSSVAVIIKSKLK